MKLLAFAALLLWLAGCDAGTPPAPDARDAWETAPADYVCTADEMAKVQAQAHWCDVNTSFFSSYCYGTAFIRNCTKPGTPREATKGDGAHQ